MSFNIKEQKEYLELKEIHPDLDDELLRELSMLTYKISKYRLKVESKSITQVETKMLKDFESQLEKKYDLLMRSNREEKTLFDLKQDARDKLDLYKQVGGWKMVHTFPFKLQRDSLRKYITEELLKLKILDGVIGESQIELLNKSFDFTKNQNSFNIPDCYKGIFNNWFYIISVVYDTDNIRHQDSLLTGYCSIVVEKTLKFTFSVNWKELCDVSVSALASIVDNSFVKILKQFNDAFDRIIVMKID